MERYLEQNSKLVQMVELDITLVEPIEILGKSNTTDTKDFSNTGLSYYLSIFQDFNEKIYLLLYDSRLKLHFLEVKSLDYRY